MGGRVADGIIYALRGQHPVSFRTARGIVFWRAAGEHFRARLRLAANLIPNYAAMRSISGS